MTKLFSARYIALTLISCLLIGAYSYVLNSSTSESEKLMANPIEVTIRSLDDLHALFDKYQYNNEYWNKGNREVPRITFEGVGKHWAEGSKKLPVETKKMIFFRLMTPLALVSNENILREREIVKSSALDAEKLKNIALKYRIIKDKTDELDKKMRSALLVRVDILPPSLALAQAAEESGWATSRFAQEGNAFFGQWDFTGNGMKPRWLRLKVICLILTATAHIRNYGLYAMNCAPMIRRLPALNWRVLWTNIPNEDRNILMDCVL
jgi:Bax protein